MASKITNRFTGEHSTILINLDHVTYVDYETYFQRGEKKMDVYFINNEQTQLEHGNVDMFINRWNEYLRDGE